MPASVNLYKVFSSSVRKRRHLGEIGRLDSGDDRRAA
jgi:hypothetical protein